MKGVPRKYSDRGQLDTVSENDSENVFGDGSSELDELGLEDPSDCLGRPAQRRGFRPGLPALRCRREDRSVSGNDRLLCRLAVRCGDFAVKPRSEAAVFWATTADCRCTLLIYTTELASRPLEPRNMALLSWVQSRAPAPRPSACKPRALEPTSTEAKASTCASTTMMRGYSLRRSITKIKTCPNARWYTQTLAST